MYNELKSKILRILNQGELSGYSVYKILTTKGVETWPNHVYTMLVEMEERGLLKSRWASGRNDGRSRHLYSLSQAGKREYEEIVRGSLEILMERFFRENMAFDDISFHVGLIREAFCAPGGISENDSFKLVIASPAYHPLICFPKFYYAFSEAFPRSMVYVVKDPWQKPLEGRRNLTFLDGSRDDIPLRSSFADYVLLQGFPSSSTASDTIDECLRVLKENGSIFVEIPSLLTTERRLPSSTVFDEYVLRLFYELCGRDRNVSVGEVRRILSSRFERVKEMEVRGKIFLLAKGKKVTAKGQNESQDPNLTPVQRY